MVAVRSGGHSGKAHRAPPAAALADERPRPSCRRLYLCCFSHIAPAGAASLAILPIGGLPRCRGVRSHCVRCQHHRHRLSMHRLDDLIRDVVRIVKSSCFPTTEFFSSRACLPMPSMFLRRRMACRQVWQTTALPWARGRPDTHRRHPAARDIAYALGAWAGLAWTARTTCAFWLSSACLQLKLGMASVAIVAPPGRA